MLLLIPLKDILLKTTRTLSMDTHYPDSVHDFDEIETEFDEDFMRHHQELAAEALKIERELCYDEN